MKILYYLAETSSFMTQWQRFHIIDELMGNGHSVTVFNPLNYDTVEKANAILPDIINSEKPAFDVFINPAPSYLLFKETILKIKSMGLPSLLICFDNLHAPFIHQEIAPYFDLVWLTSWETEYLFKKWGCNTIFKPYAANPVLLKPVEGLEIDKLCFIGTLYDDRVNRINMLTLASVPTIIYSDQNIKPSGGPSSGRLTLLQSLKLLSRLSKFSVGRRVAYGRLRNKLGNRGNQLVKNDFLEIRPSVPFDLINSIYSNHAISLNITELRNTFDLKPPVHKLHLRTFEIPMSGGLQIAPYVEELSSYFEDGEEIILCKSEEEFISKSQFYLRPDNSALRRKMKRNARKRAENEHTWNRRFTDVFDVLFK